MTKKEELWEICCGFVKDQEVFCVETIYQTDRVSENSLELIEKICEIVGYYKDEQDD